MEPLLNDAVLSAAIAALTNSAVLLKGSASPLRDEWLSLLQQARQLTSQDSLVLRIPANVEQERLLGGLDLSATLGTGKPVYLPGLLNTDSHQIICLAMAERWEIGSIMLLTQAMDKRSLAHSVIVAQDESQTNDDLHIASALYNRLGLLVPLHLIERLPGIAWQWMKEPTSIFEQPADWGKSLPFARDHWRNVTTDDALTQTICHAAIALGVESSRAMIATSQAAKVIAAMDYRSAVCADDIAVAVRLTLVWRATQIPQSQAGDSEDDDSHDNDQNSDNGDSAIEPRDQSKGEPQNDDLATDDKPLLDEPLSLHPDQIQALQETILEAALSSLPPDVLSSLVAAAKATQTKSQPGTSGAKLRASSHGKKRGALRKKPSPAARLDVLQTLRSAAPWQGLREAEFAAESAAEFTAKPTLASTPNYAVPNQRKTHIRKEDFRYARIDQQARSTMVFVVDASGSSALNRLAEAKGAIEILLGQCYVRRDQVCMVSFRGTQAQISLPVTRSLARAKRSLNGLPGGGGTPIALGLTLGLEVAKQCQKRGETAFLILLTDGKANVTRAGTGGRAIAHAEALTAAQAIGQQGIRALLLDTSNQANPLAQDLALRMRANYIALPYAGASKMAASVAQSLGSG